MCGIFGYSGQKDNAAELVFQGLKDLEYRGYDSWGVAVYAGRGLEIEKEVGKIGDHKLTLPKASVGIGHTRWATHGGVTRANAHPHTDCTKDLALIHNGIIENFEEIRTSLKPNHIFHSQTDTEVVAHLLEELTPNMEFAEAVRQAFLRLDGMNVIVALDKQTKRIVAAKKGSPLVLGVADEGIYLASDASAILPYTNNLIFIEDGWLVEIAGTPQGATIQIIDAESNSSVNVKPQKVSWGVSESHLGHYDHFMIKEIHEQPTVLRHLAANAVDKVGPLAEIIKPAYGSFMIGCGTASYAALSGSYLFSRIARKHTNSVAGSEFFYQEQYLTPESLVIAISQSGETMDIVESVQLAKKHHSKIVAVTNSLGSTLYRLSDAQVLLDAGVEKAVCSTKAFTAMVATLLLLAYQLDGQLEHAQDLLLRTADDIENMLRPERLEYIQQIARYIGDFEHTFIIGRGLSYPAALEAALKIKEVSYIHAEGFAGGELKHGVIALIEKGTPCIVFAPNDETQAAIISNAMELKARGGHIIGIGPTNHSVFDDWIKADDVGDASILTSVVPAQLLGYYLALARGYDPDKPRNLAKSVTVK
jgi:glucosamine--fructose-6-phosphate aminotransferase (isomerizing)